MLKDVNEAQLIQRAGQGDLQAFEDLVRRYENKVFAVAFRLSGNRQEGEDLAQETFIKAWKAMPNFRGEASLGTWLVTIVTNLWRDRMRKHTLSVDSLDEPVQYESGEMYSQIADQGPGPEVLYESKELKDQLARFIQELKPEFRAVLVLRDIQGYSYEEIAAMTASSLGTVKSRINRARKYLRDRLLSQREQSDQPFRLLQQEASFAEGRGSINE
jgi:RNA polymerase sigma-70 factor (ECF subfamily)